jgi:hypothetical protein
LVTTLIHAVEALVPRVAPQRQDSMLHQRLKLISCLRVT